MSEFDFDNLTDEDWSLLEQLLQDPVWRLENLYWIKNAETGQLIPFVPTPEQADVINEIHINGVTKLLILKARQLGMSTVIDLILADMAIWNSGFQGSIVDQTQDDASLKLTYKVVEAFNSMPEVLRDSFIIHKENSKEFAILHEGDQLSVVFAGKNARGGTNQLLHISEWGPIQHEDAARSDEIMNGALPSAKAGITVIETTWMGGKHGNLWNITEAAMKVMANPENRTADDFVLKFYPWYVDPQYNTYGNYDQIPNEISTYFAECERLLALRGTPYKFSPSQKLWYYKVAMPKGPKRFAEFPTLLEECFMAPVPGAIYSKFVDAARATGRIVEKLGPHPQQLVFTFWDLGSPVNTRTIYVQFVGEEIWIIDHDWQLDLTPTERWSHMLAKGYNFGSHFMPHDAETQGYGGKSFRQLMNDSGMTNIKVIPKCRTIWPGINHAATLWPQLIIHEERCEHFIASAEIYRTKKSNVDGFQTDIIVEDDSCHDMDTLRMLAEAQMNGMLKGYGGAIPVNTAKGAINRARQKIASSGRYKPRGR